MTVFLGSLGMLLGLMVMLAGFITYVRGLPKGVALRPGRADPRGNVIYLISQEALGLGLTLLALDVVLRLASRPFLMPGLAFVLIPVVIAALRQWRRGRTAKPPKAAQ